jgi:hypothetical protein
VGLTREIAEGRGWLLWREVERRNYHGFYR